MITIRPNEKEGIYEAVFSGADAEKVKELFGTEVLPTAFLLTMPIEKVFDAIKSNYENSGIIVEVEHEHYQKREYYGSVCHLCGLFVPEGHGPWMPGPDADGS